MSNGKKTREYGQVIPAPTPEGERRKNQRRLVNRRVPLTVTSMDQTEVLKGFASDVSVAGIGASVNGHMNLLTHVKLILEKDGHITELKGRVTNCEELPTSGRVMKDPSKPNLTWRLGIDIQTDSPEEKKIMAELFAHL